MNRQDKTISRLSNINLWPMDDLLKALSPTQHRELVLIYIRSRIKLNQKDYSSTFRSLLPYMLRFSSCSSLGDLLQSALFLLTGVTPEELDVNLTRQIVARTVQVVSSLRVREIVDAINQNPVVVMCDGGAKRRGQEFFPVGVSFHNSQTDASDFAILGQTNLAATTGKQQGQDTVNVLIRAGIQPAQLAAACSDSTASMSSVNTFANVRQMLDIKKPIPRLPCVAHVIHIACNSFFVGFLGKVPFKSGWSGHPFSIYALFYYLCCSVRVIMLQKIRWVARLITGIELPLPTCATRLMNRFFETKLVVSLPSKEPAPKRSRSRRGGNAVQRVDVADKENDLLQTAVHQAEICGELMS